MPLLDHFHPPFSNAAPWRNVHGAWATAMARQLNSAVLPSGYRAVAFLGHAGPAAWPSVDNVRVEVSAEDADPYLVATVELVGPRDKIPGPARRAFTARCADLLRRGRGVVIVDTVTSLSTGLYADLSAEMGLAPPALARVALSVVSYGFVRSTRQSWSAFRKSLLASERRSGTRGGMLGTWPTVLKVGTELPTVPLCLGTPKFVSLDLEASHSEACADLGIIR